MTTHSVSTAPASAAIHADPAQVIFPDLWQVNLALLSTTKREAFWLQLQSTPGVRQIEEISANTWRVWALPESRATLSQQPELARRSVDTDAVPAHPTLPNKTAAAQPHATEAGGTLAGVVKDARTGMPIDTVQVSAYTYPAGANAGYTYTNALGQYRFIDLPAGPYLLNFSDYSGRHVSAYYDNVLLYNQATPITVTEGATQTVNMPLALAGIITGVVRDAVSNAPLPNITVSGYGPAPDDVYFGAANTNGAGQYILEGLPAGNIRVEFADNTSGLHTREYFNDKPTLAAANLIAVSGGLTTTDINAQLSAAAVLTGQVTSEMTGAPIPSISVYAYDAATNNYVSGASSNASGFYRIGSLPTGAYKVCTTASGNYLSECHDNQINLEGATPINLTANTTTTLNFQVTTGSVVTGLVTAAGTGLPLSGVSVRIVNPLTGNSVRSSTTNAFGYYIVTGLRAGSYKLSFDASSAGYDRQFYANKPDLQTADVITVGASITLTNYNAVLQLGSRAKGRVTDAISGLGLPGIGVQYSQLNGNGSSYVTTDASGFYTSSVLSPGAYGVRFVGSGDYLDSTYDNAYRYGPTPVKVLPVTTIDNINGALRKGVSISGKVTDQATGAPLQNVSVQAYPGNDNYYENATSTAADGTYTIQGLPPNQYRLYFAPSDSHASEWHNNAALYANATPLAVFANVAAIDAALASGSGLTGRVTGMDGNPVDSSYCNLYVAGTSFIASDITIDAGGFYTTTQGLPPGVYQVSCAADATAVRWYNAKDNQSSANLITVTAGVTVTGINVTLLTGSANGTLTGTITAADTAAPLSASIYVYQTTGEYVASTATSAGNFVLSGLAPNSYRVLINSSNSAYLSRYYHDKITSVAATLVQITANVTTTLMQALPRAGSISGTVTTSGAPVPGVKVYVSRRNNDGIYVNRSGYSSWDGSYVVSGLETGGYSVLFQAPSPYLDEYYDNTSNSSTAQTVTVSAGANTPNINADLAVGAVISGVITGQDTGLPLIDAYAYVYGLDNNSNTNVYAYTASDGRYRTNGLKPGSYVLSFEPAYNSVYVPEYYSDQLDSSTATTVTVGAPGTAQILNAALSTGGFVGGIICNAATGLPIDSSYVYLLDPVTQNYLGYSYANTFGYYQRAARPGSYKLSFIGGSSYIDKFFNNAITFDTATPVTVTANTLTRADTCLAPARRVYLPVTRRS